MLTTKQKITRSIEYLLELEELFYNARPKEILSDNELHLGDEIHEETQIFLKSLKVKALEDCIKEFEDEEK